MEHHSTSLSLTLLYVVMLKTLQFNTQHLLYHNETELPHRCHVWSIFKRPCSNQVIKKKKYCTLLSVCGWGQAVRLVNWKTIKQKSRGRGWGREREDVVREVEEVIRQRITRETDAAIIDKPDTDEPELLLHIMMTCGKDTLCLSFVHPCLFQYITVFIHVGNEHIWIHCKARCIPFLKNWKSDGHTHSQTQWIHHFFLSLMIVYFAYFVPKSHFCRLVDD